MGLKLVRLPQFNDLSLTGVTKTSHDKLFLIFKQKVMVEKNRISCRGKFSCQNKSYINTT